MTLNRGIRTADFDLDSIKIRRVARKDVRGLFDIVVRAREEVREDPSFGDIVSEKRMTMAEQRKWFSKIYKEVLKGRSVFYVAESDGIVVGYCYVEPLGGPGWETSHVGTLGVRIKKGYRGLGIGKRLMQETIRRCRGRFETLTLAAMSNNGPAIGLYKTLGFKVWGRAPAFVKRNRRYIDFKHMYLKL